MDLLNATQTVDQVEGIVHEDTQLHKNSIDLTVNEIYAFTAAGSLDFGGSEFAPAQTQVISPQKKNEGDKYGWWNLQQGRYKCIMNENMACNNSLAILTLHNHAEEAGLTASKTLRMEQPEQLSFIIDVPKIGCHIKENARIATACLISTK